MQNKEKYILHQAVEKNDIDGCKFIINKNNNLQFMEDNYGDTPLDIAIKKGYKEIEELLRCKLNYTLSEEIINEKLKCIKKTSNGKNK